LTKDEHGFARRVDHFWRDVLATAGNDGSTPKYPVLSVFKEANVKLKEALKTKYMKQIAVAQAILDTAETRIREVRTQLQDTRTEQRVIEKRKQSFVDSFVAKKRK